MNGKKHKQIEWNESVDYSEARAAIEWIQNKTDNANEYIVNLCKMANAEQIPSSGFGMWVSLVAAYQREQEKLREKARQYKTNEWAGQVGQRTRFTAELLGTSTFDSRFGTVTVHRFLDDQGRTIVWFANTDSNMEAGNTYTFDATVKKHDEYNNWKQTVVNRLKVKEDHGVVATE